MDLFLWIENMRKKPPQERKRFALFASIATVSLIGVVWFVGFLVHLSNLLGTDTVPTRDVVAPRPTVEESPIIPPYRN